jgi:lipopolysaccharide biosynthesis glycosyltransferase
MTETVAEAVALCPEVAVVVAADDRYAMPLAVTVRSLLDHLAPGRRVSLYLLDGGISDESKRRLRASWDSDRLELHVVRPDAKRLSNLKVSQHVNQLTYYRILLPELLPASLDKVIYLDSDLLIRQDLGLLWDEPLDSWWALAVQDVAAPYMDASAVLANYGKCGPVLAATCPIPNYQELGLAANAPYLNGGVMVVNLEQWRTHHLTDRLLNCLRANSEHILWWDQYALNVVLAEHWRSLDLRWNQGAHVFAYTDWTDSPLTEQEFHQVVDDPWIVHYTSPIKPWHPLCRHRHKSEFVTVLNSTAFTAERSAKAYLRSLGRICWYGALRRRHIFLQRKRVSRSPL